VANIFQKGLQFFTGVEKRSTPANGVSISDYQGIAALLGFDKNTVKVNPTSALGIAAFYGSLRVLSNHFAMLPVNVIKKTNKTVKYFDQYESSLQYALKVEASRTMTAYDWKRVMMLNKKVYGFGISKIIRNDKGEITGFKHYPSNVVNMYVFDDGAMIYEVNYRGKVDRFWDFDCIHLKEMDLLGESGTSVIKLTHNQFEVNLTAREFLKKYFTNGTFVNGVIEQSAQVGSKENADNIRRRFVEALKGDDFGGFGLGIIGNGGTYKPIAKSNVESQLIEFLKKSDVEIYQVMGVPPFMIGDVEKNTSWGTGIESMYQAYLKDTFQGEITQFEQEINRKCLWDKKNQYVKVNVDALLRPDAKTRAEVNKTLWEIGARSANEVREMEDETPYDGGENYFVQTSYVPVKTAVQLAIDYGKGNQSNTAADNSNPA
jgi:HK97 family phage portal protein